jgi:hypothetical protein
VIKQPWLAAVSLILFIVLAAFVIERLWFLETAARTNGNVAEVTSYNSRCGGGRRNRSYSCTKFKAYIEFYANLGVMHRFSVSAGRKRGSNQSISYSRLAPGQNVPVVYDPKKPQKAYEDTLWGVWGTPIILFFGQIITFFSSMLRSKNSAP